MYSNDAPELSNTLTLRPVDRDNWRAVAHLKVTAAQAAFVAEPCYYLALCNYDKLWQPLAIALDTQVIGFCMWAIDPDDGSCWLGGILIDQQYQGRGYGRRAIQTLITMLAEQGGHHSFALSYQPTNTVAKQLYYTLGFRETGEQDDDEVVARLRVVP